MDDKAVDVEHSSTRDEVAGTNTRGLQMPEILKAMSEEERNRLEVRLRRKLDLRIMPILIFLYILNYIDRNNIAAAKLAGIVRDLHLNPKSDEFQTAVSILFVGYLLMQVPSNLLLNKLGVPALYLPTFVIIWGIISAATAATTNYGGLLAVRFFLGFVEAAYFPGCLYFLSCWYTRAELGLRTSLFYSGAIISGAFSGLIAAGVTAHMDGVRGLGAWQWLFIIEGAATVAAGLVAYFLLPNFPRTTPWLTEEEKAIAIWRLEKDIGQDDWVGREEQTFWVGFKLAIEDVKTWVLLVLVFCTVATGTVTNFFPSVVSTLGKSNVITLLLTAPPYVLCFICMCLNAWHADRTGERYLHIVLPLTVALIANILAAATTSIGPRYTAMMLMVPGVYSAFVVALSWISNTLPRPPAKRAAALALINAVSNMCSIYASYLYPDSAKPGYTGAFIHNCITAFVGICAATVLWVILRRLNKRLDRGEYVEGAINAAPGEAAEHGFRFKL